MCYQREDNKIFLQHLEPYYKLLPNIYEKTILQKQPDFSTTWTFLLGSRYIPLILKSNKKLKKLQSYAGNIYFFGPLGIESPYFFFTSSRMSYLFGSIRIMFNSHFGNMSCIVTLSRWCLTLWKPKCSTNLKDFIRFSEHFDFQVLKRSPRRRKNAEQVLKMWIKHYA